MVQKFRLPVIAALVITLALAASGCKKEQAAPVTQTIYIPTAITNYNEAGEETTKVQYTADTTQLDAGVLVLTGTDELGSRLEVKGGVICQSYQHAPEKLENHYDSNGYETKSVQIYSEDYDIARVETLYTRDELGRVTQQQQVTYYPDGTESATQQSYTYAPSEDGSVGTRQLNSLEEKIFCDAQGRTLKVQYIMAGQENQRTEYTYDENGNVSSITTYYQGRFTSKRVFTYQAVQVSPETAAKFPMY
jgi:YD repeat-containing protein